MKPIINVSILTLFLTLAAHSRAAANPVTNGKDNDTTSLKSNIVLFKMMAAPAPAVPSGKSKSLKKAGSVARTSNDLHTGLIVPKPVPNEG